MNLANDIRNKSIAFAAQIADKCGMTLSLGHASDWIERDINECVAYSVNGGTYPAYSLDSIDDFLYDIQYHPGEWVRILDACNERHALIAHAHAAAHATTDTP